MTTMATELDPELMTFLSEDPALPCSNAEMEFCAKGEAKWRALVRCPDCHRSKNELWCTPCKDLVIVTEDGFECGQCGALVFPARRFVASFEPIGG